MKADAHSAWVLRWLWDTLDLSPNASTPQSLELGTDPCLDEFVKLCRFLEDLFSLGVCRNVRSCVVNHIPLASARLEVVRVLVGAGTERELDTVERHLMMANLGGHAVAGATNHYVRRQERRVVCRREPPVSRQTRYARVGQVARNECADVI